jgi:hypothetical protein
MPENSLENALKYAMNNPHAEEAKGDFLKPEDSDKPAMDDEATSNLVAVFQSVCDAAGLAPKDAIAVLAAHDWGDDLDALCSRFRAGF